MTQEQLASALRVAANTVARWERGERSIPPHLDLALETVERENGKITTAEKAVLKSAAPKQASTKAAKKADKK